MSNQEEYVRLLEKQLKFRRGPDTPEADEEEHRLAEEMDVVWRRMDQAERDATNARSEEILRREENRQLPENALNLLRELIQKINPSAEGEQALTKRVSAMMMAASRLKLEGEHVELVSDLVLVAQQFQKLDEWLTRVGLVPKAWYPENLWGLCKEQETERYYAEVGEVTDLVVQQVLDGKLEDPESPFEGIMHLITDLVEARPRFKDTWGSVVVFLVSEITEDPAWRGEFEFGFTQKPPYLMESQVLMERDVFQLLRRRDFDPDDISGWKKRQEELAPSPPGLTT